MNVLITGGTGFIGSRLAVRCLQRGDKVTVYGMENTEAERQNSRFIKENGARVILGSISEKEKISEVVRGVDIVFHLAAAQHEMNISDDVFRAVNVEGTKNILDAALAAEVKCFVYGSTIGVYGALEGHIHENSSCNPDNIYGKTKLEAERLVLSRYPESNVVVIRIPETYGPGDRRLLKLFRAINKRSFFLIGKGENLHHLIYVDDLVEGLLSAAESERALGEVILLAGEKPVATSEMANTIAKAMGKNLPRLHLPILPFMLMATVMERLLRPVGIQPPLHRRRMDFFRKSFILSAEKAKEVLSFTPNVTFEEGVAHTLKWYRENGLMPGSEKEGKVSSEMTVDPDLSAQIEPFDSFWEAPEDTEKGFKKFAKFYKRNYFRYVPSNKDQRILVISCGAGYLVELLNKEGYTQVLGIDSDASKIEYAVSHNLNCIAANAFPFLRANRKPFDLIFAEQEINHLTKSEILAFLDLCYQNLKDNGMLFVHSLNGANPITGSEALAQNFDHFNSLTEYSLRQILLYKGFVQIKVFPLNLYIFYENPANYIGLVLDMTLNLFFRLAFVFYGKENKLFSKKIAAAAKKIAKLEL